MNDRLRELRLERRWTQRDVQRLTGIDRGNYSKMELGTRYYTIWQCMKLAIVFETSMDYLAGLTDEREPYERSKICLAELIGDEGEKAERKKGLSLELRNRLRGLRTEKKYSQVKIQMLTGVDQSNYSKLECGKQHYTFGQCRQIALAMGTSMDYLAGLTDRKQPHRRKKNVY